MTNEHLSTLHICTQDKEISELSRVEAPRVSFFPRGNLATVRRAHLLKSCEICSKEFRAPLWSEKRYPLCFQCRKKMILHTCEECGREYRIFEGKDDGRLLCLDCRESAGESIEGLYLGKREEIYYFSDGSRRRLMRLLATIDKDTLPLFVTLTYTDTSYSTHYNNPERWKLDLRAFLARFHRQFPDGSLIWRLEVVDRKSGEHIGEYMPHFHFLVFGVEFNRLSYFIPRAWHEVVKSGSDVIERTETARIYSRRGIFRYASKTVGAHMAPELGKDVQTVSGAKVGRYYGIAYRENLSRYIAKSQEIILDGSPGEIEAIRLLRAFRRLGRLTGRALNALTAFCDGAWLQRNIMKILEPILSIGSYKRTGRRYDVPFWRYAYSMGWLSPQLE